LSLATIVPYLKDSFSFLGPPATLFCRRTFSSNYFCDLNMQMAAVCFRQLLFNDFLADKSHSWLFHVFISSLFLLLCMFILVGWLVLQICA